jgi:WD40 repeat protein
VTPERWRQIEELFERAIELPAPDRAAYLEVACPGDDALRAEIELLVASRPGAVDSLRRAVAHGTAVLEATVTAGHVGTRLGPYRLLEVIGEGGMGTVYRAVRDDAEYRREVAIKIVRPVIASPALVARLRDERQLLASLDHPGIVGLLDGGTTDEGLPYLVMEYIEGVAVTTHARGLSVGDRVRLAIAAGTALQYAHQKLIVHRDVKPSNILVDTSGALKLLDFGIAKLLGPHADAREAHTHTAMPLFTVEYASPEQARGEPVSVASDVYSLGAVLYELLTGRAPQQRGATLVETLANICDRDSQRPSAVAPRSNRRQLAGDLDNIVLKALQKAPARRYPSVALLIDDLERYLGGRPIAARDATLGYRAGKFAARNRGALALAALIAGGLATATIVSIGQARRADRQAEQAERQKRSLLRGRGLQELAIGHAVRALPYLAAALREGDDSSAIRLAIADAMRPLSRQLLTIPVTEGAMGIAWSSDGRRFAITSMTGHVAIYDLAGHRLAHMEAAGEALWSPVFSPDDTQLVAHDPAGRVFLWEVATGVLHLSFDSHHGDLLGAAFTSDGHTLIVAMHDGAMSARDVRAGAVLREAQADVRGGELRSFALGPDGHHLAVGTGAGSIYLWDFTVDDPPRRLDGNVGAVHALRYSRDGTRLYSGGEDHALRVWDAARGTVVAMFPGHDRAVTAIDIDRDESQIAVTSSDNTATIHDARSGGIVAVITGLLQRGITSARFSPDGAHLVSIGGDGTFRLWDRRGNPELVFEGAPGAGDVPHSRAGTAFDVRFSPDGARLLSASAKVVAVWRVDRAPLVADLAFDQNRFGVAWSPDEARLAIVGRALAGIWEIASGRQVAAFEVGGAKTWDVTWQPGGDRIAISGDDGIASIRNDRGEPVVALVGHRGIVNRISWSPQADRVVTAGDDHTARIWNATTGALLRVLVHVDRVMSAAWRSDGAQIVTACWDHRLRLWDAMTGAIVATIESGGLQPLDASFSPDGRTLVVSSHNGEVAVWDVATRARTLSLDGHTDSVPMAVWSPRGTLIATAGYDRTLRIWDPATGEQIVTRQSGPLMSLAWNRDGTRIAGATDDGHVLVWDVHPAAESVIEIVDFVSRLPFRLVATNLERAPVDPSARPDRTNQP